MDEEIRQVLKHTEVMGGRKYVEKYQERIPTKEDADVVVESPEEFWIEAGKNEFQTIWVPGDLQIDLRTGTATVRDKIIASDRGQDGSDGALLYTNNRGLDSNAFNGGGGRGVFQYMRNVRITGIRFRGPTYDYWGNVDSRWPGYMPLMPQAERDKWHACGMRIHSPDTSYTTVEIDNCEIYGWPTMAIYASPGSPWVHHNDLHDDMMTGFGYHLDVVRGNPMVEWNYLSNYRHAIDAFGYHDSGYHARFNVCGPYQSAHAFDIHGLSTNLPESRMNADPESPLYVGQAGGSTIIERNTFFATHVIDGEGVNYDRGRPSWAVSIRGWPWPRNDDAVVIRKNWFAHDEEPSQKNGSGRGIRDFEHYGAYNQQVKGGKGKLTFELPTGCDGFTENYEAKWNNFNAPKGYIEGVGAPVNFENPETEVGANVEQLRETVSSAVGIQK